MLTPLARKNEIEKRLRLAFPACIITLLDESHLHAGHPGAATGASHFSLKIIAIQFSDLSLIKRHKMIYEQLGDLIPSEIHALKIQAKTPEETGS